MIKNLRFLFSIFILFNSYSSAQAENRLNLYIWSEYIDPKIISQFEKKFHCKVTTDLYEDNESMMAKLAAGGDSLYDIIVPSDFIIPALIKRNLIQKLPHDQISNLKNLDPLFSDKSFDPGNAYTVPYQVGTVGIYLRKQPGQKIDQSWALLFDPSKQNGSFVLMDAMRETIGSALRYLGYSLNETDPEKLKQAAKVLYSSKERSLGFDGGVGGRNKVLSGNADMAMVYSGDGVRGMTEDPDTYFFVPREGAEVSIDNLAIPAKAPNFKMALTFINYILEAEIGAQLSNFNQYTSPNLASRAKINPDDLNNPAIYPSEEIMKKLEEVKDIGNSTRLYDEIWSQVKN